ncbi:hypothetical protein ABBQ32_000468 [Trebouxia sp. C0010 RCD-2024]
MPISPGRSCPAQFDCCIIPLYICLQVKSKAVQQLSRLVAQYEPQLLRACGDPAEVPADKLRAAVALVNSVQQWWLDGGKPKTCAAAVKVVPYHTPMHRRLFHREEANLRALSSCQPDGRNQHEPYAPAYHAAFVDPEGTPNRRGKLIMV